MQGNDIAEYSVRGQGVIFEGVLATLPDSLIAKFYKQRNQWERYIQAVTPHELSLKAMIDSSVRLGIATDVYTFVDPRAVNPIEQWLSRKGISVAVFYYMNVEELAYDLKFQRSLKTIYVENQEQASIIGLRSHVVDKQKAWIV